MKRKGSEELRFINYLRSLEKALSRVNTIISDSQQREELSPEQEALIKEIHDKLYWTGKVRFDEKCVDYTKLTVC